MKYMKENWLKMVFALGLAIGAFAFTGCELTQAASCGDPCEVDDDCEIDETDLFCSEDGVCVGDSCDE